MVPAHADPGARQEIMCGDLLSGRRVDLEVFGRTA